MRKSACLQRELAIAREERDILKKAIQVFVSGSRAVKYRFILSHRHEFNVSRMCRMLNAAVAAASMPWLQRIDESRRRREDAKLLQRSFGSVYCPVVAKPMAAHAIWAELCVTPMAGQPQCA